MNRTTLAVLWCLLGCTDASRVLGPAEFPVPLPEGPLQVGALVPGDVLTVHYHSIGCFHDTRVQVVLSTNDGGVVASAAIEAEGSLPAVRIERKLTPEEVAALDRSLRAIRAGGEGFCTTMTSYALTLERGGWMASDSLTDGVCALWRGTYAARSTPPGFSFGTLVAQLDSIRTLRFHERRAGV